MLRKRVQELSQRIKAYDKIKICSVHFMQHICKINGGRGLERVLDQFMNSNNFS